MGGEENPGGAQGSCVGAVQRTPTPPQAGVPSVLGSGREVIPVLACSLSSLTGEILEGPRESRAEGTVGPGQGKCGSQGDFQLNPCAARYL